MEIIKKIKVKNLLTKLTERFVGGLDDEESEISLIRFNNNKYNIGIKHKGIKFGNPGEIYLFPQSVEKRVAEMEYNRFLLI